MFTNKYFIKKYPGYEYAVSIKRWFLPFSYYVSCGHTIEESKEIIKRHKVGFVVYEE